MTKEETVQSIKRRILDEYRKHHNLPNPDDWVESAARKIYSTYTEIDFKCTDKDHECIYCYPITKIKN